VAFLKWEAAASSGHVVGDFLRFVLNPRFQEKLFCFLRLPCSNFQALGSTHPGVTCQPSQPSAAAQAAAYGFDPPRYCTVTAAGAQSGAGATGSTTPYPVPNPVRIGELNHTGVAFPEMGSGASSASMLLYPNPRFQEKISRHNAPGTANANSLDP
jgi:hypothetical protein